MLSDYTPTSEYYAETIGQIASEYDDSLRQLAAKNGIASVPIVRAAAACEGNCSGGCSGTCSGSCSGGCSDTCSGSCKDTCKDGCTGSCKDTCKDTCKDGCTGACKGTCSNNCSGDCTNDCKSGCSGSCKSTCNGSCMGSCSGVCEDKCQACQTYCQNNQSYTSNSGTGGKTFSWSSNVGEGYPIYISASDWNDLATYVRAAAAYCASSVPSLTIAVSNEPITASIFNNMDTGIGSLNGSGRVGSKSPDIDLIKASDFKALTSNYNSAQILDSLTCCQLGETPASEFGRNQPCKNGQTCTNGQSCSSQGERGPQVGS